jgi:hypothetical protein
MNLFKLFICDIYIDLYIFISEFLSFKIVFILAFNALLSNINLLFFISNSSIILFNLFISIS